MVDDVEDVGVPDEASVADDVAKADTESESISAVVDELASLKSKLKENSLEKSQLKSECTSYKKKIDSLESEIRVYASNAKEHSSYNQKLTLQIAEMEERAAASAVQHQCTLDEQSAAFKAERDALVESHKRSLEALEEKGETAREAAADAAAMSLSKIVSLEQEISVQQEKISQLYSDKEALVLDVVNGKARSDEDSTAASDAENSTVKGLMETIKENEAVIMRDAKLKNDLQAQIDAMVAADSKHILEISALQEKCQMLQQEKVEMELTHTAAIDRLKVSVQEEGNSEASLLASENKKLTVRLKELEEKCTKGVADHRSAVNAWELERDALKLEKQVLTDKMVELDVQCRAKIVDADKGKETLLKEHLDEMNQLREKLTEEHNGKMDAVVADYVSKLNKANSLALNSAKSESDEMGKLVAELQQSKAKVEKLQSQIEEQEIRIVDIELEREEAQQKITDFQKLLEDEKSLRVAIELEKNKLSKEVDSTALLLKQAQQQLELQALNAPTKNSAHDVQLLQEKFDLLEAKYKNIQKTHAKDLEQLQEKHEIKLNDLNNQMEILVLDKEQLQMDLEVNNEELSMLREQQEELEKKDQVFKEEAAAVVDSNGNAEEEISRLLAENKKLKDAIVKMHQQSEADASTFRTKLAEYEKDVLECASLREEILELEIYKETASGQIVELQEMVDANSSYEEMIENLTEQNQELSAKYEQLQLTVGDLEMAQELNEELDATQRQQLDAAYADIDRLESSLRSKVEEVQEIQDKLRNEELLTSKYRGVVDSLKVNVDEKSKQLADETVENIEAGEMMRELAQLKRSSVQFASKTRKIKWQLALTRISLNDQQANCQRLQRCGNIGTAPIDSVDAGGLFAWEVKLSNIEITSVRCVSKANCAISIIKANSAELQVPVSNAFATIDGNKLHLASCKISGLAATLTVSTSLMKAVCCGVQVVGLMLYQKGFISTSPSNARKELALDQEKAENIVGVFKRMEEWCEFLCVEYDCDAVKKMNTSSDIIGTGASNNMVDSTVNIVQHQIVKQLTTYLVPEKHDMEFSKHSNVSDPSALRAKINAALVLVWLKLVSLSYSMCVLNEYATVTAAMLSHVSYTARAVWGSDFQEAVNTLMHEMSDLAAKCARVMSLCSSVECGCSNANNLEVDELEEYYEAVGSVYTLLIEASGGNFDISTVGERFEDQYRGTLQLIEATMRDASTIVAKKSADSPEDADSTLGKGDAAFACIDEEWVEVTIKRINKKSYRVVTADGQEHTIELDSVQASNPNALSSANNDTLSHGSLGELNDGIPVAPSHFEKLSLGWKEATSSHLSMVFDAVSKLSAGPDGKNSDAFVLPNIYDRTFETDESVLDAPGSSFLWHSVLGGGIKLNVSLGLVPNSKVGGVVCLSPLWKQRVADLSEKFDYLATVSCEYESLKQASSAAEYALQKKSSDLVVASNKVKELDASLRVCLERQKQLEEQIVQIQSSTSADAGAQIKTLNKENQTLLEAISLLEERIEKLEQEKRAGATGQGSSSSTADATAMMSKLDLNGSGNSAEKSLVNCDVLTLVMEQNNLYKRALLSNSGPAVTLGELYGPRRNSSNMRVKSDCRKLYQ